MSSKDDDTELSPQDVPAKAHKFDDGRDRGKRCPPPAGGRKDVTVDEVSERLDRLTTRLERRD